MSGLTMMLSMHLVGEGEWTVNEFRTILLTEIQGWLLQTKFLEDLFVSHLCGGACGDGKGLGWTLLLFFHIVSC